jgi:hypothetical protein
MSPIATIIVTALITFALTLLASYFSFKYFRKKILIFNERLYNNSTIVAFNEFLIKNRENIFFIDISLTIEHMEQFKKDFNFFLITSPDGNLFNGGLYVRFNRKDEEQMFIDYRPSSRRIKGYFKITHASGPQQGQFTVVLSHVPLELIYNYTR